MKLVSISDSDLFIEIQKGSHDAFDLLFDKYWEGLYKVACARLNNTEDAKDLVQDLLINFWSRKSSIEIQTSIENYLYGALKLSIINYFRSIKVNEVSLEEATERLSILEESITDVEDYLELELVLEEAVNLMPETLRKIYDLRCNNVPIKEIASQLGLADQTVKNYISELLRRLKHTISEKYPEKHLTYLVILLHILNK